MKPRGRTISMKMPQNSMLTDNWNAFTITDRNLKKTSVRKPKISRPNSPTNSMGLKKIYPGTVSPNSESLLDEKVFIDNSFFDKRNRVLTAVEDKPKHGHSKKPKETSLVT